MLCEKCQQREATVHTTNVNGDEVSTVNLCEECFRAAEPRRAEDLLSAFKAGCFYCGSEPDSTALDLSVGPGGKERIVVLCKRCAEEFYGYWQKTIPFAALNQEQLDQLPKLYADLHGHMKKWVAERGFR